MDDKNPDKGMPKRKPLRLTEYDYRQNGAYFVTLCTYNRIPLFGDINFDGPLVGAHLCVRPFYISITFRPHLFAYPTVYAVPPTVLRRYEIQNLELSTK